MKRLISIAGLLIAAAVAIAATTHTTSGSTEAHPPTKASLTNAYVEAAQYWQNRPVPAATAPPTTASLTNAYVAAARYWQSRPISVATAPPTTASLMNAYVKAAQYWQHGSATR